MKINIKLVYLVAASISYLVAWYIVQTFFGRYIPDGGMYAGGGLFGIPDFWRIVLFISLFVFAISTTNLLFKGQSNSTSPILKTTKKRLVVFGICLLVWALPAAFMTEFMLIGLSSFSGYEGIGYLVVFVMIVGGINTIYLSSEHTPKIQNSPQNIIKPLRNK